uniref:Variant surface glycoprotein 1125.1504 n=1 Tax=Trypanosoma brucei TaxID=5691 RepID=A0A1J0R748_9TRYP|nr:variant surface glycoprotein 1125.1504 [Trypanosoma brucei]
MSAQMKIQVTMAAVAALTLIFAGADDADAVNMAELNAVCDLVKLIDSDTAKLPTVEALEGDIDILRALNMSTAEPEWRKQFPKEEQTGKAGPDPCQQDSDNPNCHPEWKQWAKDSIKAAAKGTRPNDLEVPTAKLESPEGRAASITIAAATAAAIYEKEQFDQQYKQDLTDVANKVKTAIGKAVYGSSYTVATQTPACPTASGDDRQTICKMPNTGAALCHVLACLCSKNNAGTMTNDVCGNPTTQSVTKNDPLTYVTAAAELIKVCQKKTADKTNCGLHSNAHKQDTKYAKNQRGRCGIRSGAGRNWESSRL